MFEKYIKLSLITVLVLSSSLYADDGFDDEDEFSDDIEIVKVEQTKQKDFVYYGSITASSEYAYQDKNEIASNKLSTNLKLEYVVDEFHKIKSTIKAYKAYETNIDNDRNFDINELSVEGTFHNGIDGKIGRQIVVWGKSDNIRITDILNPMDMTTPGMVDIKDLRLGRNMTKLDYFSGKWTTSAIVLHENRFSTMSEVGSDYYSSSYAMLPKEPSDSFYSGIALSINGNLEGQDVSFYYANQYVDNKDYKSNMLGFAYNKVLNSFLFKTEIAYFDNYDINTINSRTDSLVGLEYNGISDGSISLEVANKTDDTQYALRFTQSYINETLDFTVLYSGYGDYGKNGGFIRSWFDYDYSDEVAINFGIIDYLGGDVAKFEALKDNDRIFGSVKYSF